MKRYLAILFALSLLFALKAYGQTPPALPSGGILRLVQTIPLPTEGYMDRIAIDVKGQRLFVSGEHNHTPRRSMKPLSQRAPKNRSTFPIRTKSG